jgi:DNA-binding YbaB/EbfC family protein
MVFSNIMQQMQKVQEDIKKAQQELAELKVTGESGAGLVKITTNGNGDTLSIEIDDSIYREDKKVLQDLLIAAWNDVKKKREHLRNDKLKQYMLQMGLPVNFNFPFMSS